MANDIQTTGIETAIRYLARNRKHGVTPAQVQEHCGLTRRFSRWDMKRLAKTYGYKLAVTKGETRSETAYRFVARV